MHVVGLDIGGANLKAANADGRAATLVFPVWQNPEGLSAAIESLLREYQPFDVIAVTMTAELADCYRTKQEGVDRILNAVEQSGGRAAVHVWQTGAEFVTPEVAREIPMLVAAANWHALATWVGRLAPEGESLLIDVGTTTTDIIPLSQGVPVPRGFTDRERLLSGELVYSGVRRTPVCALVSSLPYRGEQCPVAAELFATTLDAYLILGNIAADAGDLETANCRPATREEARDRLARLLCSDSTEFTFDDALTAAQIIADTQRNQIASAVERVLSRMESPCSRLMVSGTGYFLVESAIGQVSRLSDVPILRLNEIFDRSVSDAACAFAVARLAQERVQL